METELQQTPASDQDSLNQAVADGGAYELLKKRLSAQGTSLRTAVEHLNQNRQQAFGASRTELIGKVNVHTQNSCQPVDMAQVNDLLLFGYQVFVGLKSTPAVEDVLGLYRLEEEEGQYRIDPQPLTDSFLDDPRFKHSFQELFTYYRDAHLVQISRRDHWLYVVFQIGSRAEDRRVYRWQLKSDGQVDYVDDQGHTELGATTQQDIEWQATGRSDQIAGDFPHISIRDRLFVECTHGDLTVKLENNTESGQGIYAEPVDDPHQSVADADIQFAEIGCFILLRIRPNREQAYRYLIFNSLTESVTRADAIGHCCKRLPDDQGLLFANGYALSNGEVKLFQDDWHGMRFFHSLLAPNGEDALYIFFDPGEGAYLQYAYNLIEKTFAPPGYSHGYSLYADGRMLLFRRGENNSASKTHPLRIWQTPFMTPDHYEHQQQGAAAGFYRNLGNPELVRGIAELNTVIHFSHAEEVSQLLFESLIQQCNRTLDQFHWLADAEADGLDRHLRSIRTTTEQIIDEFSKVQALQRQAQQALAAQRQQQDALLGEIRLAPADQAAALIALLARTRLQAGHLISLREQRYIDRAQLDTLGEALEQARQALNLRLLDLLQEEKAYSPYLERIARIDQSLDDVHRTAELEQLSTDAGAIREDLNLVNQEVAEIESDDPTRTTRILDLTTEVMARLNATEARLRNRRSTLRSGEADAEFASQLKLLNQAMTAALGQADSPEQCDQQRARLLGMVDKLESRFAEFDQYLGEIYRQRDEIQSALEARKQQQIATRQKRIEHINQAAILALDNIDKRSERFETLDALNSYFAADGLVQKYRGLCAQIADLGDNVRADTLLGRLKALQDRALRALRDNQDIFEQGGALMRMGRHRFSVNRQPLALTLVEREQALHLHLTGTEYYQPVEDPELLALRTYAAMDVASESPDLYRAEYLAYLLVQDASRAAQARSLEQLYQALEDGQLGARLERFAAPRYREGYIKGVHDRDAQTLLEALLPIYRDAGLLRFHPQIRAQALLFYAALDAEERHLLEQQCRNALLLREALHSDRGLQQLQALYADQLPQSPHQPLLLDYLMHQFGQPGAIRVSRNAADLGQRYLQFRHELGQQGFTGSLEEQFVQHRIWLEAYTAHHDDNPDFIVEAALLATLSGTTALTLEPADFSLQVQVRDLLGQHPRIAAGTLSVSLNDWLDRARHHQQVVQPGYEQYLERRRQLLETASERLRLSEFKARPLTSFVRNRLISESYLPLIGDNLAKQMGATGDQRRTDQMGMLLLISPPGYGKTTLIEYIASKLGLVFMKINCPSLGHDVVSLDPADAPNSTAASEVNKINLALEMGNNVLLYLDDIQHTHPEFLQKFISLSDGTRRIEGVWDGQPKTYDMRGRKFAVVMAGNPYTESGEVFKIPDMLANRADIYNLGDMLSDQRDSFELSYIENALTSNPVLAPLANRNLQDLYLLIRMARGEALPLSDLEHSYSSAEADEIIAILQKMLRVQSAVLTVNQQYISSAACADAYRTEPPFKLQGSYRNMNKLAEKLVAVMSDDELDTLIDDHYLGEAQTLTQGAEENLLKLAELRQRQNEAQRQRWQEIKASYQSQQQGRYQDGDAQMAAQMGDINRSMRLIAWTLLRATRYPHATQLVAGLRNRNSETELDRELDALQ